MSEIQFACYLLAGIILAIIGYKLNKKDDK